MKRAVPIILLVCASALPATGQRSDGIVAWVTCASGEPVVEYFVDRPAAHVVVHEERHVAQAHAAGGCARHVKRLQLDSLYRLRGETDAFCAEIEAGHPRELTDIARTLSTHPAYAQWGWSYALALRELEARCG